MRLQERDAPDLQHQRGAGCSRITLTLQGSYSVTQDTLLQPCLQDRWDESQTPDLP